MTQGPFEVLPGAGVQPGRREVFERGPFREFLREDVPRIARNLVFSPQKKKPPNPSQRASLKNQLGGPFDFFKTRLKKEATRDGLAGDLIYGITTGVCDLLPFWCKYETVSAQLADDWDTSVPGAHMRLYSWFLGPSSMGGSDMIAGVAEWGVSKEIEYQVQDDALDNLYDMREYMPSPIGNPRAARLSKYLEKQITKLEKKRLKERQGK